MMPYVNPHMSMYLPILKKLGEHECTWDSIAPVFQ